MGDDVELVQCPFNAHFVIADHIRSFILTFKTDKAGTKLELEPGDHRFPFRFYIPDAPLPIPFESKFGYIRYKIKATIDRPWRFNHDTKRLFSIQGVDLDLNRMRPTVGVSLLLWVKQGGRS